MARLSRWIASIILAVVSLPAASALAQSGAIFDSLTVEVWPEYDRPQALVILTGTLPPGAALPAEVGVHIPARAGQPNAVAVEDASGTLLQTGFDTAAQGDWLLVTLAATQSTFRIEYYDPGLAYNANERSFTFEWPADFGVGAVTVRVQQPVNASGFTSEPALRPAGAGAFGLDYYEEAFGALQPGQMLTFTFSYSKPDSTLSAAEIGQQAPLQSGAPAGAPTLLPPWLIAGLALGGLLIVAGAAYWYWSTGARRASAEARPRRRRVRSNSDKISPHSTPVAGVRFCTQCGTPRLAVDRFCRQCGAALE